MNGNWEIGIPTGIGTDDPTFPYSGSSVLATKLDTNYTSEIPVGNPHNAISPNVNAKYYKDVKIRYKRWLNIDYFDKTSVKYSVDEGNTWITAMQNTNSVTDRSWKSIRHGISPQATRKSSLQVKFSLDETDDNTEYGGWNIDNFAITGDYIAQDVGIKEFTAPISQCGLGMETVKVVVKNYGGETVNTPFLVGYSLNNGA